MQAPKGLTGHFEEHKNVTHGINSLLHLLSSKIQTHPHSIRKPLPGLLLQDFILVMRIALLLFKRRRCTITPMKKTEQANLTIDLFHALKVSLRSSLATENDILFTLAWLEVRSWEERTYHFFEGETLSFGHEEPDESSTAESQYSEYQIRPVRNACYHIWRDLFSINLVFQPEGVEYVLDQQ